MCLHLTLNNQLELTYLMLFQMGSRIKMLLNYFYYYWDFIDYKKNAFMYHFEILIETYSDFTLDNATSAKPLGFKYMSCF